MVITFYSYRGGVGRSMALANVGEMLADMGYRVVLCDWDLEAPGLERYLVTNYADDAQYRREMNKFLSWPGLTDLLEDYKKTLTRPADEMSTASPEYEYVRIGNLRVRRPSTYAHIVVPARERPGSLSLLTAGRRDGEHLSRYAEAVRRFDWQEFYDDWAGDAYIDLFRRDLVGDPRQRGDGACDLMLVDSRTGVTEQGGVCTHHLADIVVLVTAANDLNMEGAKWMMRALTDKRLVKVRGGRALRVLPVASRIEQTAQRDELVDFRRRYLREFAPRIEEVVANADEFALASEIPYMPFYSFHERVVAREPEEQREQKLYAAYHALAQAIVGYGVRSSLLREPTSQGIVARARTQPHGEAPRGWDTQRIMVEFQAAFESGHRGEISRVATNLEKEVLTRDDPFPENEALEIVRALRRGQQFDLMARLAAAFLESGLDNPRMRHAYALAQIEQRDFTAALATLQSVVTTTKTGAHEYVEARLLIGRVYKQLYLEASDRTSRSIRNLERAINEYMAVYHISPVHLWAGINVVALVSRARRDEVVLEAAPDPRDLAESILTEVHAREKNREVNSSDLMTAMEASLGLGDNEEAVRCLAKLVERPDVGPFELASLERQLTTVWQLSLGVEPGITILSVIRGEILKHRGVQVEAPTEHVSAIGSTEKGDGVGLESLLGDAASASLKRYRTAGERARSVVLIEDKSGAALATGFVLPGSDLDPSLVEEVVVITVSHVFNAGRRDRNLVLPEDWRLVSSVGRSRMARSSGCGIRHWFSSTAGGLDVTIAVLDRAINDIRSCPIASAMPSAGQEIYLISHSPAGAASLSIRPNLLVGREDPILRYRDLTGERDPSGTPIFNDYWELVGIHHADASTADALQASQPAYGTKEGIWIGTVARELARQLGTQSQQATTRTAAEPPVRVFLAYSHIDEALRDELQRHLALLQRRGLIELWNDREIKPGEQWSSALENALEAADLIVSLVSADFLASDVLHMEMQRAIERHQSGAARLVPVIVRPCAWQQADFAHLQVLPANGKPVTAWPDRDLAWVEVVRALEDTVHTIAKNKKSNNDKIKLPRSPRARLKRSK